MRDVQVGYAVTWIPGSAEHRPHIGGVCWVPCLRPTARCAVGLHGMTLGRANPFLTSVIPAPLASEARERDQAGTQSTSGLALGCRCTRECATTVARSRLCPWPIV